MEDFLWKNRAKGGCGGPWFSFCCSQLSTHLPFWKDNHIKENTNRWAASDSPPLNWSLYPPDYVDGIFQCDICYNPSSGIGVLFTNYPSSPSDTRGFFPYGAIFQNGLLFPAIFGRLQIHFLGFTKNAHNKMIFSRKCAVSLILWLEKFPKILNGSINSSGVGK